MQRSPLSDLKQDPQNANRGTKRGGAVIEESITELGAGRSILLDSQNRIIAGNKTAQAALRAGHKDVLIVETDGTQLIAVKRTDLNLNDDARAKKLAVADNRAGELSLDWDPAVLEALNSDIDLSTLFSDEELAALIREGDKPDDEGIAEAKPELADELQKKWKVETGQVWPTERSGVLKAIEDLKRDGILATNAQYAMLEIPKNSAATIRLYDVEKNGERPRIQNPQVGTYLVADSDNAYLCATGRAFPRRGTVQPIHVKHVCGEIPIETSLQDVYFLTALAWTRPEDCARDPITIKLTDRRLGEDAETFDLDALEFHMAEQDGGVL